MLWKPNLEGLLRKSRRRAMPVISFLRCFLHGEPLFDTIFFFFFWGGGGGRGSYANICVQFCVQILTHISIRLISPTPSGLPPLMRL